MDPELVKACFESLKKTIGTLYSENSKADTDGQIDMMPILRQCAKMEYALEGDIASIILMDNEDRRTARARGDKIMDTIWGSTENTVYTDFANNVSTFGATPEMAKYAAEQRKKNNRMLKLTIARGRVEGARELLEQLKAELAAELAQQSTS